MAKLNVTVQNDLDDVKLTKTLDVNKKKNKKVKKDKTAKKARKNNYFSSIIKEMSNVTWTSKKNLVKYSLSTIVMIIVLAVFFFGLSSLFQVLYKLVQDWVR